jgi:hypothetical protein
MRGVCAWCGKELDGQAGPDQQDAPITHGICAKCSETALRESGSLLSFLDGMVLPVLLLDANAALLTANAAARTALHLDLPKVKGVLAGDVIECVYAARPGGCGRQEHCVACQIRASVTKTYLTGEALRGIMAYQVVRTAEGGQRLHLRITTEKVRNAVLLRIDSAERTPGSGLHEAQDP